MRIALIGDTDVRSGFAWLRLQQFREGLGGSVDVVDWREVGPLRADAVVSAGTWGPVRAAVAAAGELPLCVDLPGDPFADAQAVGGEAAADAAAAVFVPALLRGDAFTTISTPSRHALLGQLGLLGRLARTPPGEEWVAVAPIAWHFPGLAEQPRRDAGLRVALVGSFNTWFDGETLLAGLLGAMERAPVEVVCVGGPVPGHHVATFEAFAAGARASRHAARFSFQPWTDDLRAVLAPCQVAVCLDRPGYEPEFGSRTRLLLYLHQGLRVIATARCELARELRGFVTEVPPGDTAAVTAAILAPPPTPDRAPLRTRYSVERTTASLREWAAAPRRRAIHGDADVLAALLRERDASRAELAAVRGSATWRLLDRLKRFDRLRRIRRLTDTPPAS